MADRDIFEEMVRAGAVAMWGSTERDATKIARMVLSAALAGRQVVDDWAAVETAVRRGIEQFARAYWIPANNLHGGDPDRRDRMAARWAEGSAVFVTACIREDLRKAHRPHNGPHQPSADPGDWDPDFIDRW